MTELSIEPFARAHLDGLAGLVVADGWSECAVDVERTSRALSAPGVTTLVPIDDADSPAASPHLDLLSAGATGGGSFVSRHGPSPLPRF